MFDHTGRDELSHRTGDGGSVFCPGGVEGHPTPAGLADRQIDVEKLLTYYNIWVVIDSASATILSCPHGFLGAMSYLNSPDEEEVADACVEDLLFFIMIVASGSHPADPWYCWLGARMLGVMRG